MIQIRVEYCDGCGACVEICPSGALYLVDGKATVDEAQCRECELCVSTCPREAIVVVGERVREAEPLRLPAVQPEPMAVRVGTESASLLVRSRLLPLVGAALVWAGREIVPRLADYLVSGLDRRIIGRRPAGGRSGAREPTRGTRFRSGPHRHRWRGGGR